MREGPSFTKKETGLAIVACESTEAGMTSPLQTPPLYINMHPAKSSMTITAPTAASSARSLSSSCSSMHQQLQQPLISSPYNPYNFEANPSPNLRNTGESQPIKTTASPLYRHADLLSSRAGDCSFTAQQSQASPYPTPTPNPNPYLSTADPLLVDDIHISGKTSQLSKDHHFLHQETLVDQDHQVGLICTDDQVFGGLRSLHAQASSPLLTEGLQESWLHMMTDPPYISIQREAAPLMSPAPEITGLGDLQEVEMGLFSGVIAARKWSLCDESSSCRKGVPERSELPSTAASAIASGGQRNPSLGTGKDIHRNRFAGDAEDGFSYHSAEICAYSCHEEMGLQHGAAAMGGGGGYDQSPAQCPYSGIGKSMANEVHGGAGACGGESEGLKHTSPATEMSSSSESELQDDEHSNTSYHNKPVGAHEASSHEKRDGDGTPDLGKSAPHVDNKSSKKPRKKGQRRVREARVALLTKSEVEHLEDGYRWRKYGQKAVKNSPHPRSYYRCTFSKCFVKKRVERCNEDPSLVVTTYEGQHTHHSPALLRGCHDMQIDPLVSGPFGTLHYNKNNAPFIPWHDSSLNMHPNASHYPPTSMNSTLNQLFRPLLSPPGLLLTNTKPLPSPTAPLSYPSTFAMHPHLQAPHHFMPAPQHVMQLSSADHAQPHPHIDIAPCGATLSPLVDKGLLDDMVPHTCARKSSPSLSS